MCKELLENPLFGESVPETQKIHSMAIVSLSEWWADQSEKSTELLQ